MGNNNPLFWDKAFDKTTIQQCQSLDPKIWGRLDEPKQINLEILGEDIIVKFYLVSYCSRDGFGLPVK